ncbi:DUF3895 domain-containing protein [Ornithinibacillus halophilus]|uniref:DUF3895 domain-containing protein n=1 Tax=Ornithinibacillus halophilus TaxID=930117 RepID=A0A1M5GQA6_9BACI|nr:DUF3895 domain-containing protein [Ornithinibacillus halophilus]SHG05838.1 Protein of unknown function [Ornithinibacillus halophilus]
MEYLKQAERDVILKSLSLKQRTFLEELMKRGKRTEFANVMAKEKAATTTADDHAAFEWEFVDYIDAGPEWRRAEPKLLCECGRPLRYQYIVQNRSTGDVKKFGIVHFEEHVGLPPHLALEIKKGLEKIDYEMDEILIKVDEEWTLATVGIADLPSEIDVPNDIQQQLDLELPLLDRQVRRLRDLLAEWREKRYKEELAEKREAEKKKVGQSERFQVNKRKFDLQGSENGNLSITNKEKNAVFQYIKERGESEFWASEVCEHLIINHGMTSAKYSSGAYQIFGDVCIVLKEVEQQGAIEFIQKDDVNDRLYKVVDSIGITNEIDDDSSQLSLF